MAQDRTSGRITTPGAAGAVGGEGNSAASGSAYHVTQSPGAAQGVVNGVDPIDPILRGPVTSGAPAVPAAPEGYDFAVGLATHRTTGKPTLLSNFAERVGAKTYGDVYGGVVSVTWTTSARNHCRTCGEPIGYM